MPAYPHDCACGHSWDVWSTIALRDEPASCPKCASLGVRQRVVPVQVHGSAGDWNKQEMNPGLGCVTSGVKDAERKAKAMGLEPLGNESPEKVHKHFDTMRAERREQRYRDAADLK